MKIVHQSTVDYVDHMGDDLAVVNAARVSFDKESFIFSGKDEKLISYLAKHKHWSPFAHTSVKFRVSAPIFVARQLVKHQVGGVWNEVSRRYVEDEPVFYFPKVWRGKPETAKQGSSDKKLEMIYPECDLEMWIESQTSEQLSLYNKCLEVGMAPEQARMILPQNTMTSWIWTGSLVFWDRVCKLRMDSHAQQETQDVAIQIDKICSELFPVSWKALKGE